MRTRDFIQIEYGKMDILLECLKNADEGVMLHACQTLQILVGNSKDRSLKNLESMIDLIVRHRGIQLLKTCCQAEGDINIKKAALSVI